MHAILLVSLQGDGVPALLRFKIIFRCICTNSLALQFVTEHPKHGSPGTANYIDARTTWFDHAVEGAKKQGLTQVVVIAAGFDSRAYRLHAAGLQVCDCSQMYCPHAATTYRINN